MPHRGRARTMSPRCLAVVAPHSTTLLDRQTVTAECVFHPVWCFPTALFPPSKSLPTPSCVREPLGARGGLLSARQSLQPPPKPCCSRTLRRQLQTGWMVTPTLKYILNNFWLLHRQDFGTWSYSDKGKNLKVKYNTEREIPLADLLSLTPSHPAFSRKDKMQKRRKI